MYRGRLYIYFNSGYSPPTVSEDEAWSSFNFRLSPKGGIRDTLENDIQNEFSRSHRQHADDSTTLDESHSEDVPDNVNCSDIGFAQGQSPESRVSNEYGWAYTSDESRFGDFPIIRRSRSCKAGSPTGKYGFDHVNEESLEDAELERRNYTESSPSKSLKHSVDKNVSSQSPTSIRESENRQEISPYSFYVFWLVIGLGFSVVCMLIVIFMHSRPMPVPDAAINNVSIPRDEVRAVNFKKELRLLIKKYSDQNRLTWAKVLSGVDAIFDNSTVPHVLVVTGAVEKKEKVTGLAMELHHLFSKSFDEKECSPIDGSSYSDLKSRDHFFDRVEECLSRHSVLIHDLDQLHGEVAMHLHAFADNENAPFKSSAVYLTIISDCTDNVEKCLKDLIMRKWGPQVDEDRISSLNSRIFNLAVRVV